MNTPLQRACYEDVDEVLIKEENDFEIETTDYTFAPGNLCPQQIDFTIPKPKCGEVLVACTGKFTFVCTLCLEEFVELQCFGEHIQSQHIVKSESKDEQSAKGEGQDPLRPTLCSEKMMPTYDGNVNSPLHSEDEWTDGDYELPELDIVDMAQKYTCDICARCYAHKRSLQAHIRNIHENKRKPTEKEKYPCDICNRIYLHKRSLLTHKRNVHDNGRAAIQKPMKIIPDLPILNIPVDELTCIYCDKKCEDTESLRSHLTTHTGNSRFECKYCNKTFSCRTTRLEHLSVHTGERHHQCPHCPKMMSTRGNLKNHIRSHLKIKNYSCDYCDKRFVQVTEKKVHELTHTGEKRHQCEECGQQYNTAHKLKIHMHRHKNIRNYKCEICNKAFYGKSALKNHMPTHTGEKPFSCNICGQRFPRKKSLRTHKQLHTGEKKYVCIRCGKAFAQCAGLYSHMKSHGEKS